MNAICPAAIEGAMDELFMIYFGLTKERMADAVPLGRTGKPDDVAGAVLFTVLEPGHVHYRRSAPGARRLFSAIEGGGKDDHEERCIDVGLA